MTHEELQAEVARLTVERDEARRAANIAQAAIEVHVREEGCVSVACNCTCHWHEPAQDPRDRCEHDADGCWVNHVSPAGSVRCDRVHAPDEWEADYQALQAKIDRLMTLGDALAAAVEAWRAAITDLDRHLPGNVVRQAAAAARAWRAR